MNALKILAVCLMLVLLHEEITVCATPPGGDANAHGSHKHGGHKHDGHSHHPKGHHHGDGRRRH